MNDSPRVLMLIERYPPEFTGAGRQLASLTPYLRALGANVRILTSGIEARCDTAITDTAGDEASMVRLRYPGESERARKFPGDAARWLRRHHSEFDVLHIHGMSRTAMRALLAVNGPSIVKFTLLGSDDPMTIARSRFGRLKLRVLRRAKRYVAPSSALFLACKEAGLPDARIVRIPNGVDVRRFRPPTSAERADAKAYMVDRGLASPESPLAVYVGSVEPRKGIDVLIPAWREVIAAHPNAVLAVIGPTLPEFEDFAATVKKSCAESGLGTSIRFCEGLENPELAYWAAECFVFPSRGEGLPNALIEAQACGLPAIAAALPGITDDIVVDGETGIIVPQDDAAAIARAVDMICSSPGSAVGLGRAAAQLTAERFGFETVAGHYAKVYQDLLQA